MTASIIEGILSLLQVFAPLAFQILAQKYASSNQDSNETAAFMAFAKAYQLANGTPSADLKTSFDKQKAKMDADEAAETAKALAASQAAQPTPEEKT